MTGKSVPSFKGFFLSLLSTLNLYSAMTFDAGDNVHVLQRQVPAQHEAALPHAAPAQAQLCTLRQQAHASQGTTAASRYRIL